MSGYVVLGLAQSGAVGTWLVLVCLAFRHRLAVTVTPESGCGLGVARLVGGGRKPALTVSPVSSSASRADPARDPLVHPVQSSRDQLSAVAALSVNPKQT